MKNVSGIKISHKISSLMIGLIVGFVLMGVAYYAQISVDIKQEKTQQQFQQAEQSLERALQAHEVYGLLFLPGFSTADKVTNLSGRGVGLDDAAHLRSPPPKRIRGSKNA